jgi:uncharacterized repeat protein (TIGR01451 family)
MKRLRPTQCFRYAEPDSWRYVRGNGQILSLVRNTLQANKSLRGIQNVEVSSTFLSVPGSKGPYQRMVPNAKPSSAALHQRPFEPTQTRFAAQQRRRMNLPINARLRRGARASLLVVCTLAISSLNAAIAGGCTPTSFSGPNLVKNPDFSSPIPAGLIGQPAVAPVPASSADAPTTFGDFAAQMRYDGPNTYPDQPGAVNSFSIFNEAFLDINPPPAGRGSAFNGSQQPFPGDAAYGVAATPYWLYSDGNALGQKQVNAWLVSVGRSPGIPADAYRPYPPPLGRNDPNPLPAPFNVPSERIYTIWEQEITGLEAGADYEFSYYVSNVIEKIVRGGVDEVSAYADPEISVIANGTEVTPPTKVLKPVTKDASNKFGWERRCVAVKADATGKVKLQVRNSAPGNDGDDLGLAQLSLKKCVAVGTPPRIDVVKSTTGATNEGSSKTSFLVPYTIKVGNTGPVALPNVQVTEDLSRTFKTGNPTIDIATGAQVVIGNCVMNVSFNGTTDTKLLDGLQTLAVGASCTITFTARVAFTDVSKIPSGPQDNTVFASSTSTGPNPGHTFTGVSGETPVPPASSIATDTSSDKVNLPITGNPDLSNLPDPANPSPSSPTPVTFPTPTAGPSVPNLELIKSTTSTIVNYGDVIPWKLTLTNKYTTDVSDILVTDALPVGLIYVKNSSRVDGVAQEPVIDTTSQPGRQVLKWTIAKLLKDKAVIIDFNTILTAAFKGSVLENTAEAAGKSSSTNVTVKAPRAVAAVKLLPGPFSGDALVLGRVYFDTNDNNSFEDGIDQPLSGARVYLSDGRYAVTDNKGRYSISNVGQGWCAIRLDPLTAPFTPKAVPRDQGQRGTRTVSINDNGVYHEDFPLVPLAGSIVKARATTVTRGDVMLVKTLQQTATGYLVQLQITLANPVENLAITDPLPGTATRPAFTFTAASGALLNASDDGKTISIPGVLEAGKYTIIYAISSPLPPEFAVTDPDINYEEVTR